MRRERNRGSGMTRSPGTRSDSFRSAISPAVYLSSGPLAERVQSLDSWPGPAALGLRCQWQRLQ